MRTFFLLYVISGAGWGNQAWGGPALLRFEDLASCEAAASVMRGRRYVYDVECVQVGVKQGN